MLHEDYLLIWREYPKGLLSTLVEDKGTVKPLVGEQDNFLNRYTQVIEDGNQLVKHLVQETKIDPVLIPVNLARNILGWDV